MLTLLPGILGLVQWEKPPLITISGEYIRPVEDFIPTDRDLKSAED
jgi:hypothetical protein